MFSVYIYFSVLDSISLQYDPNCLYVFLTGDSLNLISNQIGDLNGKHQNYERNKNNEHWKTFLKRPLLWATAWLKDAILYLDIIWWVHLLLRTTLVFCLLNPSSSERSMTAEKPAAVQCRFCCMFRVCFVNRGSLFDAGDRDTPWSFHASVRSAFRDAEKK